MGKNIWRRIASGLSIASLLINSLLPFGLASQAYAQELPAPEVQESIEPSLPETPSVSPTPSPDSNLTPTVDPIPTLILEATPTPTPEITPTATPEAEPDTRSPPTPTPILAPADLDSRAAISRALPLKEDKSNVSLEPKNQSRNYKPGEVIVKFKRERLDIRSAEGKTQINTFEKRYGLEKKSEISEFNTHVFKSNKTTAELIKELKVDPNVEYVEPNYKRSPASIGTNDTYKDLLWGLDNTGQTVNGTVGVNDADVDAPEAWSLAEGNSVIVAIIDNGVDYNHPDLLNSMWSGSDCKSDTGVYLGGCNHGYDFDEDDKTPLPSGDHGTILAGIIAAQKNNALGVIGVAPQVKIMALKFDFYVDNEIRAINFAIQNGAKIINASFGGDSYSQVEYDAINAFKNAGGVFITSAGNNGSNNDGGISDYPSSYDLSNIISVAAINQSDTLCEYSNYGPTSVDVAAPGVNIYSTNTEFTANYPLNESFDTVSPPSLPSGWTTTGTPGTYYLGDAWGNVLYADYYYPYANNSNYLINPPATSLSGASNAKIEFWTSCDTQYSTTSWTDYLSLEFSADGTNYSEVLRWDEVAIDDNTDPNDAALDFIEYDIPSNYFTNNFKIRFRWVTDSSDNDYGGCLIDDVKITKNTLSSGNYYRYTDGTSMAGPFVAGIAGLVWAYNPALTATEVKNAILQTGDSLSSLSGKTVTGKRVNAYNALAFVAPNNPPTTSGVSVSTNEDESKLITLAGSDLDGDSLTYSIVSNPANGSLGTVTGNQVTYTPNSDYNGTDSFTFKANDGTSDSNVSTVDITVGSVNDAPVANDDSFSTAEETSHLIDLTASDIDLPAQTLTYSVNTGVSHGTLSALSGNQVTYTPDENYVGSDSFTFKVNDGVIDSNTAIVAITVTPVNDAPVANPDTESVDEDTVLTLAKWDLVGNDEDVDGDTLTLTDVSNPVNGSVLIDGDVVFTPTANYNGPASFDYTVSDGALTDTATVSITVDPVNDIPTANDGSATASEDGLVGITLTGSDIDGDTLTYSVVDSPINGTLGSVVGDKVTYTPNANYTGSDSFTFKINDGSIDSDPATISITVNEINDPPVLDPIGNKSVNELDTLNFTASASDPDSSLTYNLTGAPTGAIIDSVSGAFSFTPTETQGPGEYTFTVNATDGVETDSEEITVTVNEVNVAPIAQDESISTQEDTFEVITLVATDSDIPANTLTYSIVDNPSNGNVSLDGNEATYTPDPNYNGLDSFTYKVNDGVLDSNVATISITVSSVNDAPVVSDNAVTTDEDLIKLITLSATDVDTPAESLTYAIVANPTHGTASLSGSEVTYTPDLNYNGSDLFTYLANDGKTDSNIATVSITVNSVNDEPIADPQSVSTDEDTPLTVTLAGSDADGDTLTYSIVSTPTNGALGALSGNQITYTPNANFTGDDSFTFKVDDIDLLKLAGFSLSVDEETERDYDLYNPITFRLTAIQTDTATISVTVNPINDAPEAVNDTKSVDEDTTLTLAKWDLVGNDIDVDGDTLSLTSVSAALNGSVIIDGDNVVFTPTVNYFGFASFDYMISDGTLTDTATVAITVNPVNDAPISDDGSTSTNEDTLVTIDLSASDVDGDSLTYSIVSGSTNGILGVVTGNQVDYTPNTNYTGSDPFTFKANDGSVDSNTATVSITVNEVNDPPVLDPIGNKTVDELVTLTFTATASDPDNSLTYALIGAPTGVTIASDTGVFSFTPTEAQGPGSYTFTVEVTDGTTTDSEEITITVNEVNIAPVAQDDLISTDEDTAKLITLDATDLDLPANSLTYSIVSGVSHGVLSVITDYQLTYTPESNYNGEDSFTFKVNDGSTDGNIATVSITVNPINDAPEAVADAASFDEDDTLTLAKWDLVGNDADIDGDTLTLTSVSSPVNGSVYVDGDNVIFAPTANYNGPASFDYTISDGLLNDTAAVSITVNAVNDIPVADAQSVSLEEDNSITITLTGSDVEGDSLSYSITTYPLHGTLGLVSGSQVDYSPDSDYTGSDSFEFKVNDGTADSIPSLVDITVTPFNDPPVLDSIGNKSVNELEQLTFTAVANDPEGTAITYSLDNNPIGSKIDSSSGLFEWIPTEAQGPGSYTFSVIASDGAKSDSEEITVTINEVNATPVADNDSVTTPEDTEKIINLSANDSDLPAQTLTYFIVSTPTNGDVTLSGDNVTYTPNANYNGDDSFTYKANDGESDSNIATITITVSPVNDVPEANDGSTSTDEDAEKVIDLSASDVETASNNLVYSIVSDPTHGSVSISGYQATYTPAANYYGSDNFTFRVNDGEANSNTATINITINPINDSPTADTVGTSTSEETPVDINLSATDIDGDPLSYSIVDSPTHGTLSVVTGNQVTYTPNVDYAGDDSFTYKANDGIADSNTATVDISVNEINDPPVLDPIGNKTVDELVNLNFTVTAQDPDSVLTYSLTNAPEGATIDSDTGIFNFTPTEAQGPGQYTLTVNTTDGENTDFEEITVTVNEVNVAPAALDDSISTDEDTQIVTNLLATDFDLPADTITFSIVGGPIHGTVDLVGNEATYTPDSNYNGADSFTYKVNDGEADSNSATIDIVVNPVNDAPEALDDTRSVDEDGVLTASKWDFVGNDTDIDGDTLNLISVSDPVNGSVVIDGDNVVFIPTPDYNGSASFTYTISDGFLTDNATVSITVNPINDAPVADDLSVNTAEDTQTTVTFSATDIDGDTLTYSIVDTPSNGILGVVNGNQVTYTPGNNYVGSDSFTYKGNDGSVDSNIATVTINVTSVNDTPVLDPIGNKSVNELENLSFTVTATDPDSSLTYNLTGEPAGASINADTGEFSFTPTEIQGPGDLTLIINVTDGVNTDSEEIVITVNEVNVTPVAEDDSVTVDEDSDITISLNATDSDIPANTLSYSVVSGTGHGSLGVISGNQLTYTPSTDFNGTDSFTFKANDGSLDSNTATVSLTISPVNDTPVANPDTAPVNEDEVLTVAKWDLVGNDTDVDGDSLSLTSVSGPVNGEVVIDGDNVVFTPTANYNGPANFDYTISDGTLTDTTTVSITVNSVNDTPVANDGSASTTEGAPVTITLSASDVDGDSLTYSIVDGSADGSLGDISGNQVTYTPNADYTGADSFTFKVNDGTDDSNTATVSVTVNLPPVISNEATNTPSETSVTITWTTDHSSTSRVIYDTTSHAILDAAPNYGYASSTVETDTSPKVTSHSVIINGLTSGTTYYYRAISHGSPEVVGEENSFVTETETGEENNGQVAGTSTATSSSPPVCSDQKPGSAPILVSAISSGPNEVTLTWSSAKDPVTYYLVAFGVKSEEMIYGNPNIGGKDTDSYTVKGLSSGATYYFKVRAGNNCMPGDFSNEVSTSVYGEKLENNIPEGFVEGVLGETIVDNNLSPEPTPSPELTNVQQIGQNGEVLGEKTSGIIKYLLWSLPILLVLGVIATIVYRKRSN
ncbi:tandem-95 repeat protein [Patescibacteria group bacterium]